ncbi:MAG: UDP-N-acetylmuramate--L-alanine ligase [Pseudomonadota bacterium]|nr:UDP-N-acetylmuramate--L-alanine ligase [Pseudomonadota bacterium]
MKALPLSIGTLHFVGIGGIGMSGIAEILHNLGYTVQGSDIAESANVKRLTDCGIKVFIGQCAENVKEAAIVIISSAIKEDNPELKAARAAGLPVALRAEMLAELMRLKWSIAVAGTHGKTTTTSLIGCLFEAAGMDPTVINGGIINAYGTNTRLGAGDWLIAEADESDGTFLRLPATIGIVTNIDPEHLDHYGSFEALKSAFFHFLENLPFYGFAAVCIDHPEIQNLIPLVPDRRIVTYGTSPQADVRAVNVRMEPNGAHFDVLTSARIGDRPQRLTGLSTPMLGLHNVQNALAAITTGLEMGFTIETIRTALAGFAGVKRRFTRTGCVDGITVIDDYGHHPIEIAAVLKAARQASRGRVIAVLQPHRYSRLAHLFDEFCTCCFDADHVFIADVYEAGEKPITGADAASLVEGMRAHGHRQVVHLQGHDTLATTIAQLAKPDDFVMCMGAGDITRWAYALPGELAAILKKDIA